MAVQPQTPYKEYTANGSTKSFALEFDCDNQDHLIVLVDDVEAIVGTWALSNGAVVFGNAPATGKKITVQRNTPFRRDGDFQSYDNSFRPGPVNKGFDWIWLKLQELGVADWILSTRINDLRAYVERQDSVLQENIDNLKTYVDDRDYELRAYLLEEIRKQGVALDQLDEYYNYLMQQLAQVAIDRGWAASFIVSADGSTQQEINDFGGAKWRNKPLGYDIGSTVKLDNGDIVKSTVANNIVDPNINMTGWLSTGNIGEVESIADLLTIPNPKNGSRVFVKSYHVGLGKGGNRFFTYDSSKAFINNYGTIINGWVSEEILIHTPEMWGAKGDRVTDDEFYINNMFKTLSGYVLGDNVSYENVQQSLLWANHFKVRLIGTYRHTKTIWIPTGFQIEQPSPTRWKESINCGFFYDPTPSDYDTAGVSTIAYQSNENGSSNATSTYKHITDLYFKPKGTDFDDGKFITHGWDIVLTNLSIMCNPNVTLGLNLLGFFGETNNIVVGNRYLNRDPKVGVHLNLGWGTAHYNPRIRASVQGWVSSSATTTNTLYSPWISVFSPTPHTVQQIFKSDSMTETGTVGITNIGGTLNLVSPTYEGWHIGIANVDGSVLRLDFPYFESTHCKYEFYNIASHADINLKNTFGGYFYGDTYTDRDGASMTFKRSAVFVKDMSECTFKISGLPNFGVWRWFDGVNADKSIEVNFMQYDWNDIFGNWDLIKTCNLLSQYENTIYIDPVGGSDENSGLLQRYPRKTLASIKNIVKSNNAVDVVIKLVNSLTISENHTMPIATIVFEFQKDNTKFDFGNNLLALEGGTSIKYTKANLAFSNQVVCGGSYANAFVVSDEIFKYKDISIEFNNVDVNMSGKNLLLNNTRPMLNLTVSYLGSVFSVGNVLNVNSSGVYNTLNLNVHATTTNITANVGGAESSKSKVVAF